MTVALPIFIASLVVFIIHPHLVKIAKMKKIVDNPNARKLNKVPVPVLGGVGVFFGLMFGIGVAGYYTKGMNIQFELIVAMMVSSIPVSETISSTCRRRHVSRCRFSPSA